MLAYSENVHGFHGNLPLTDEKERLTAVLYGRENINPVPWSAIMQNLAARSQVNVNNPANFGGISTELVPANRTEGSRWIELISSNPSRDRA